MNKFLLLSFLFAVLVAISSARPEPEIIAWNEVEDGIAESIRVPRGVLQDTGNLRKPNCVCIRAENCPCRNNGRGGVGFDSNFNKGI